MCRTLQGCSWTVTQLPKIDSMSRTSAATIQTHLTSCEPLITDVTLGAVCALSVLEAIDNPWQRNSKLKMVEELRYVTVVFC